MTAVIESPAPTVVAPERRRLMGSAYDLSGAVDASSARLLAGLDWEPEHRPLFIENNDPDDPGYSMLEKDRAVVRADNGHVFGVVGAEHKILSNAAFFDIADTLLDQADLSWEAAQPFGGARAKGASPFLVFQLGEGIQVAGQDAVNAAVLLNNGHVGNTAATLSVLPIRMRCSNVVTAALRAGRKGKGLAHIAIQHSGDLDEKVKIAIAALEMTSAYMREFADLADRMAATEFGLAEFEDFLSDLIPLDPDAGDKAKKTVEDRRATFRRNWRTTPTLSDEIRGTAWGALNVVTEVIDHGNLDARKSSVPAAERRLNSVHFGTGARLRDRAYNLLAGV